MIELTDIKSAMGEQIDAPAYVPTWVDKEYVSDFMLGAASTLIDQLLHDPEWVQPGNRARAEEWLAEYQRRKK